VKWIGLDEDGDNWRSFVFPVMKLFIPHNEGWGVGEEIVDYKRK